MRDPWCVRRFDDLTVVCWSITTPTATGLALRTWYFCVYTLREKEGWLWRKAQLSKEGRLTGREREKKGDFTVQTEGRKEEAVSTPAKAASASQAARRASARAAVALHPSMAERNGDGKHDWEAFLALVPAHTDQN